MSNEENPDDINPLGDESEGCGTDISYYTDDDILSALGDNYVSSRTFGKFFLPSKRVPKNLLDQIRKQSDQDLSKLLTGDLPLLSKSYKMGYWKNKGLPFDKMKLSLYGAIGLADDHAVLDAIIGIANQFELESEMARVTVADLFYSIGMDPDYDVMQINQNSILREDVFWHHIKISDLVKHLGLRNSTPNKETIKKRLLRIDKMQFFQTFFLDGKETLNPRKLKLIADGSLFFICDRNKLKDKNRITSKIVNDEHVFTYTDIIVGIEPAYHDQLDDDGFLSRDRLHSVYPILNKTRIVDFIKWIDSNKRMFFHIKYLTWAINMYYDSFPQVTSQNQHHIRRTLFNHVVEQQELLEKHLNLTLVKEARKEGYSNVDYKIYYNGAAK